MMLQAITIRPLWRKKITKLLRPRMRVISKAIKIMLIIKTKIEVTLQIKIQKKIKNYKLNSSNKI